MHRFGSFLIVLMLAALSGCAGGASSSATSDELPPQATQPTAAATATVVPPTTTTVTHHVSGGDIGTPLGALSWRDQALRNDAVQLAVTGLAAPQAGQSYIAQPSGDGGELPLGALAFEGDMATLSYSAPNAANLLGAINKSRWAASWCSTAHMKS